MECRYEPTEFSTLHQYHPNEDEPWQSFSSYQDICRDQLCETPPCTGGTLDLFSVTVSESRARDRFLFIEEPTDPSTGTTTPFFDSTRVFRSGGFYRFVEGPGSSSREFPLLYGVVAPYPHPVGHVRKYSRGACSDDESSLEDLRNAVAYEIKSRIESHPKMNVAEYKRKDQVTLLGTDRCGDFTSRHRDYVHLSYRFLVWPWVAWNWSFWIDIWWRFVTHTRDRYLLGSGGPEYVPCVYDESHAWDYYCDYLVPGSRCGTRSRCEKPNALDVADYGVSVRFKQYCHGDPTCKAYFSGFKSYIQEDIVEDQYRAIFVELIDQIRDRMWSDVPELVRDCGNNVDCQERFSEEVFESRCVTEAVAEQGYCEVRPHYVYGVNLYPAKIEFVFAQTPSDPAFLWLNAAERCKSNAAVSWSEIFSEWTRSHWED